MKIQADGTSICFRCKKDPPLGFGLRFTEITGSPFYCSLCVHEALFGSRSDWSSALFPSAPIS